MNIALIGCRGVGKTSIGRLLARDLDKKLISTDEEIEKKAKLSIDKLIKKYGKEKFRDIESDVVESISNFDECVFDTSNSIVLRNENIVNLKKSSLIILLTADVKTLTSRIKNSMVPYTTKICYITELKDFLQEHEYRYKRAADYTIDTTSLSPEEVCNLISHFIQMELQ